MSTFHRSLRNFIILCVDWWMSHQDNIKFEAHLWIFKYSGVLLCWELLALLVKYYDKKVENLRKVMTWIWFMQIHNYETVYMDMPKDYHIIRWFDRYQFKKNEVSGGTFETYVSPHQECLLFSSSSVWHYWALWVILSVHWVMSSEMCFARRNIMGWVEFRWDNFFKVTTCYLFSVHVEAITGCLPIMRRLLFISATQCIVSVNLVKAAQFTPMFVGTSHFQGMEARCCCGHLMWVVPCSCGTQSLPDFLLLCPFW